MFTGIIEEKGTVKSLSGGQIEIACRKILEGTKIGDSICVNGVCLTVTSLSESGFSADVMNETLSRSNLGFLKKGSSVNLERAMSANGRFGGHFVSGHIDGTGTILKMKNDGNAVWIYVSCSSEILNLIVEKGSIAIDGISLTVASVSEKDFSVSVIPHTRSETNLLSKKEGDTVNLENDIIGKYVERLMKVKGDEDSLQKEKDKRLMDWLSEN